MFTGEHLPEGTARGRRFSASFFFARTRAGFDQGREYRLFTFSNLRTLFLAPQHQPSYFQKLAPSLSFVKDATSAFPCTSALFVRSFLKERKSTPLFSVDSALFWRKGGILAENS